MIKKILLSIAIIIIIMLIIMLVLHLSIEADKDRCMSMPFSEMMEDESCVMFWEAMNE